jgi:hypothetical protein
MATSGAFFISFQPKKGLDNLLCVFYFHISYYLAGSGAPAFTFRLSISDSIISGACGRHQGFQILSVTLDNAFIGKQLVVILDLITVVTQTNREQNSIGTVAWRVPSRALNLFRFLCRFGFWTGQAHVPTKVNNTFCVASVNKVICR